MSNAASRHSELPPSGDRPDPCRRGTGGNNMWGRSVGGHAPSLLPIVLALLSLSDYYLSPSITL